MRMRLTVTFDYPVFSVPMACQYVFALHSYSRRDKLVTCPNVLLGLRGLDAVPSTQEARGNLKF